MSKLLDEIGLRFVSGNSVPVERATLTRAEYDQLRALLSAQEPTGWRPIETAPRDGTYILIARAGEDVGISPVEIVEWCTIDQPRWEEAGNGLYRKVFDTPLAFWNGNGHRATHWMPLPEPPRELAKQEAK